MSLVERLEKLAKELDQQRWRNGIYDADKADQSDLVAAAANEIREFSHAKSSVVPFSKMVKLWEQKCPT